LVVSAALNGTVTATNALLEIAFMMMPNKNALAISLERLSCMIIFSLEHPSAKTPSTYAELTQASLALT
jgi:hypothetical protein